MLSEIARALSHGGRLVIRFFEGSAAEPFAHVITTAYYWPVEQMRRMLSASGFDVLDVATRQDSGKRAHAGTAAIVR
jgi:hypothetical protein